MWRKSVIVVSLGFVLLATPAAANVDDFMFEQFSAVYELDRDSDGVGSMAVSETLVALFPDYDQNRGIARLIPLSYRGVDLETSVSGVTDGSSPRQYSLNTVGAFLEIESVVPEGSFVRGRQVYEIRYNQRHIILQPSDSGVQEFYWDINGTGWPQLFGRVAAEIRLSELLATSLEPGMSACYVGGEGSTRRCEMWQEENSDGSVTFFVDHTAVFPFETVTVAIGFEPNTFVVVTPSFWERWFGWLAIVAGAIGLVTIGTIVWWRRGRFRDELGRPVIIAEYAPPTDVSLVTAAHLTGQTAKIPAAAMVELAIGGAVRIEAGEKKNRWRLHRTERELTASESAVLTALVGTIPEPGATVDVPHGSSNDAPRRMATFIRDAQKSVVDRGYYREGIGPGPTITKVIFAALGALIVVAALGGDGGFLWFPPDTAPGAVWFSLFIGGALIGLLPILTLSKKPLSTAGAEVRDHLEGLKLYIDLAEKDRLAYLQSPQGALREPVAADNPTEVLKLYERLLPWAIVLGVDKKWLGVLEAYYEKTVRPAWFINPQHQPFADAFSTFSSQTAASFSSSGSSGSGGGGFAGGGGGGGGGGGR